jgi:hypothetical protein
MKKFFEIPQSVGIRRSGAWTREAAEKQAKSERRDPEKRGG